MAPGLLLKMRTSGSHKQWFHRRRGRPGFPLGWLDCQPPQVMTEWLFPGILKHFSIFSPNPEFFFKKKRCLYVYMPVWSVQVWALAPWSLDEGVDSPELGVPGGCELGIWTQILSTRAACSLDHWGIPLVLNSILKLLRPIWFLILVKGLLFFVVIQIKHFIVILNLSLPIIYFPKKTTLEFNSSYHYHYEYEPKFDPLFSSSWASMKPDKKSS